MKRLLLFSVILMFSFSIFGYAADSLRLKAVPKDSITVSGIDFVLFGGLGIADDNKDWGSLFRTAPAFSLGLEIPFTKAHVFAIELYGHLWIAKKYSVASIHRDEYMEISNDRFYQTGLSSVLKYYLGNKNSMFRASVHFGAVIISQSKSYNGLDMGLSLFYNVRNNLSISLMSRILFRGPNLGGSNFQPTPNLLMLNANYKFKLKI